MKRVTASEDCKVKHRSGFRLFRICEEWRSHRRITDNCHLCAVSLSWVSKLQCLKLPSEYDKNFEFILLPYIYCLVLFQSFIGDDGGTQWWREINLHSCWSLVAYRSWVPQRPEPSVLLPSMVNNKIDAVCLVVAGKHSKTRGLLSY